MLWPDRRRDTATQFCDLFELKKLDFEAWSPALNDDQPDPKDKLNEATVEDVVREVERTRIRSIRNRRDQVLTDIVDTAQASSLEPSSNPTGSEEIPFPFIKFYQGDSQVGIAFPVVGFPDSILLQGRHDLLTLNKLDLASACIVYDELGMTAKLKGHLDWLNQSLAVRTVSVATISKWLKGLVP